MNKFNILRNGIKINKSLIYLPNRSFAIGNKNPKPEEGVIQEKKHENKARKRFSKMMRWELVPVGMGLLGILIYKKYQTEFLNLMPVNQNSRLNLIPVKKEN